MTTDTLNKYNLIIAIDFGTTYSGFSIRRVKDPLFAHPLDEYPRWGEKEDPTTLFYKKSSDSISTETNKPYKYGSNAYQEYNDDPKSGYYVANFKLWLDRTAKKEDLPILPPNMTPVQVIADYLSHMREEIYMILASHFPVNKDPSKYRFCMAVPTMWSEESKNTMREAAILSELIKKDDPPDKLLIVDEAVAAALCAEHKSPELKLSNGSLYMICDAGGGTVDLAVFEKDDSSGANGLKEITMGTGSSCGSAFLNIRFKDLLDERLSKYPDRKEVDMEYIIGYFEFFKIIFYESYDNDDELSENLELLNEWCIDNDYFSEKYKFTMDEMFTKVIDPVVDKVICMIEKQFEQLNGRHIDAMFITGGFGQSPYLQKRIKDAFENRSRHIKVVEWGNMAVMKGAALFGANPRIITQRILRRTYGIKLCSPDETKGDTKAQFDKDKFHVYIHKGHPVNEKKWFSKKMIWSNDTLSTISLYAYDGEEPIHKHPNPQEIDLVARLATRFKIDTREKVDREIYMMMRFGLDRIEVKVNISGVEFEYGIIHDVTGEKPIQNYKGCGLLLFFTEKFRSFKDYVVHINA